MRTIADIKKEMTDQFVGDPSVQTRYQLSPGLTFEDQFSKVSIESIVFYVIAVCIWSLENLFSLHKKEVKDEIAAMKPHSLRWYSEMAKKFQYGFTLPDGEIAYDNTGVDPALVEASKIIQHAAAVEGAQQLQLKVATDVNGSPAQLGSAELIAFENYIRRIKDAGVFVNCTSDFGDDIDVRYKIYYDPLVLNANLQRLDGTNNQPVREAILTFLSRLPFNGLFVPSFLTEALQDVEGVVVAELTLCEVRFGLLPWTAVPAGGVVPRSGYFSKNWTYITLTAAAMTNEVK